MVSTSLMQDVQAVSTSSKQDGADRVESQSVTWGGSSMRLFEMIMWIPCCRPYVCGAFLTVEHPNNPAGFKTSSGLFVISDKAKECLLSLATLKDLGCVEETFPEIAPLQVKFISFLLLHLQFRWMVGTEELQPRLHIYSPQALKYKVNT